MIQAEDGQKMSKSKGNVVTPDSVVEKYGADALRVYELFIAPFEQSVAWSDRGVQGTYRFLGRFWNLVDEVVEAQGSGVAADEAEAEKGRQVLRTLQQDHPQGHARHRHVPLQHRRVGAHGAAERGAGRVDRTRAGRSRWRSGARWCRR